MAFQYNLPTIIVISATVRFFEFIVIPLGVIRFIGEQIVRKFYQLIKISLLM